MNYRQLMIKELQDLYKAETEQASQLPQANDEALRTALEEHASETEAQALRIRQILEIAGEAPAGAGEVTPGLKELVSEDMKSEQIQDAFLKDLALIAAAAGFSGRGRGCGQTSDRY